MNMNIVNSRLLQNQSVAFVCDAENISFKYIHLAIDIVNMVGGGTSYEAFGCWSSDKSTKWIKSAEEYDIQLVNVKRAVKGVDTVDKSISYRLCSLSESPSINVIVLATSDAGYIDIISTMKNAGNVVIGLGEDKTNTKFRNEFDFFFNLTTGFYQTKIQIVHNMKSTCELVHMLRSAISLASDSEGWALVSAVGHYLKVQDDLWQKRAVGLTLLSLLKYLEIFEIYKDENDSVYVREK